MKPNELMIGDWVRFNDPDTNETELHRISQEDFSGNDKFRNCFSEIEITAEILEANGIKLQEVGDNGPATPKEHFNRYEKFFIHTTWKDTFLWYDRHAKYWHLQNMNAAMMHYVHELQHALCLAGLDDMADNFKIEKGGEQ